MRLTMVSIRLFLICFEGTVVRNKKKIKIKNNYKKKYAFLLNKIVNFRQNNCILKILGETGMDLSLYLSHFGKLAGRYR